MIPGLANPKQSGMDLLSVITGEIGDNARNLLKGAGILLHMYWGPGMVKDAIDTILSTPLK